LRTDSRVSRDLLTGSRVHWPWALAAVLATKSRPTTKR